MHSTGIHDVVHVVHDSGDGARSSCRHAFGGKRSAGIVGAAAAVPTTVSTPTTTLARVALFEQQGYDGENGGAVNYFVLQRIVLGHVGVLFANVDNVAADAMEQVDAWISIRCPQ